MKAAPATAAAATTDAMVLILPEMDLFRKVRVTFVGVLLLLLFKFCTCVLLVYAIQE